MKHRTGVTINGRFWDRICQWIYCHNTSIWPKTNHLRAEKIVCATCRREVHKIQFCKTAKNEAFWHIKVKNAGLWKSVLPCFSFPFRFFFPAVLLLRPERQPTTRSVSICQNQSSWNIVHFRSFMTSKQRTDIWDNLIAHNITCILGKKSPAHWYCILPVGTSMLVPLFQSCCYACILPFAHLAPRVLQPPSRTKLSLRRGRPPHAKRGEY